MKMSTESSTSNKEQQWQQRQEQQKAQQHTGVNQLGGIFVNGRPLPPVIRNQIIRLSQSGVRPCDISRRLLVSHGCVSKILSRYNETGSAKPGLAKGHKSRRTALPRLVQWKIGQMKAEKAERTAGEIRDLLVYYRVYDENQVPPIDVILHQVNNWPAPAEYASGLDRPTVQRLEHK